MQYFRPSLTSHLFSSLALASWSPCSNPLFTSPGQDHSPHYSLAVNSKKICQNNWNPWPVGLVFSTGRGGPVGILPTWDLLRGPRRPTTPPRPQHRDRRLDFGKKNPPKDDSPFLLFFCRRKVFNRSSPVQDFDSSNQGAPTSFSLKKRRGGV